MTSTISTCTWNVAQILTLKLVYHAAKLVFFCPIFKYYNFSMSELDNFSCLLKFFHFDILNFFSAKIIHLCWCPIFIWSNHVLVSCGFTSRLFSSPDWSILRIIEQGLVWLKYSTLQALVIRSAPPNVCHKNPWVSCRVFSCLLFAIFNRRCRLHLPLSNNLSYVLSCLIMKRRSLSLDAQMIASFSRLFKWSCSTTITLSNFDMWGALEDFDVVIDVSKLEVRESNSFKWMWFVLIMCIVSRPNVFFMNLMPFSHQFQVLFHGFLQCLVLESDVMSSSWYILGTICTITWLKWVKFCGQGWNHKTIV